MAGYIAYWTMKYGMVAGPVWLVFDLLARVVTIMLPISDRTAAGIVANADIAGLIVGLILAVWWWRRVDRIAGTSAGTAHHATQRERKRAGLYGTGGGVIIGRDPDGKPGAAALLRFGRAGHLLTCAPTRSGKGVSGVIPNLLTYPGSVVCLDVKGENATVTARARRDMGQLVHVLDPFELTTEGGASCNPMAGINPAGLDCIDDAATLAAMLVVPNDQGESHWDDEAKAVLQGLILQVATLDDSRRHLGTVRDLVTLPPDDFAALLEEMATSSAAHGMIARTAAKIMQKDNRERSGVISTAQRHTAFLDSPRIRKVLASTTVDFATLKGGGISIYLVLPAERLNAYRGWLRVMFGAALTSIASDKRPAPVPVLWVLDEFPALGRMEVFETAMGLMAGYGVKLWLFVQDLAQLKGTYPKWETFLSNASVFQAFGVNDMFTAEYVSKLTGDATVLSHSTSAGGSGLPTDSKSEAGRRLLTPDEVRRLPAARSLVFVQGVPVIQARKVNYLTDPEFVGRFDRNPLHA
jgi:type IV secretion system protein VirD4